MHVFGWILKLAVVSANGFLHATEIVVKQATKKNSKEFLSHVAVTKKQANMF